MTDFPKCFYPTEIVFVDDSQIYLQTLDLSFETTTSSNFTTFSNPEEALSYINGKTEILPKNFWEPEDAFSSNCYSLKLNVFNLHKKIYDASRFSNISVVVADHDLGSGHMQGIEFCKHINNQCIQKILFTGQADHSSVIKAFNDGQIQRYIPKQSVSSLDDVLQITLQAQEKYFKDLTGSLNVALTSKPNFPLAIHSKTFQKYFRNLVRQQQIEEYYILDAVGSFLLINRDHQCRVLLVQNEDQCQANYLEFKDELEPQAQEKLKNGELILYNPSFWDNKIQNGFTFLPANTIEDELTHTKFFYAQTDGQVLIDYNKAKFCTKNNHVTD